MREPATDDVTPRAVRAAHPLGQDDGLRGATAAPRPRGELVPSNDDLLERTLAFSGSYVSDDGRLTIRRSIAGSGEYSGNRFAGYCDRCARAQLIPIDGEPLRDLRAAMRFAAAHDHGDVD